MKQLSVLLVSFLATVAIPNTIMATEAAQNLGPEIIKFKMGDLYLPFQHWKHQTSVHNDCFNCHKTKIGVIDGWNKDVAHKTCIPCHDLDEKGPVLCHECHSKKILSPKK